MRVGERIVATGSVYREASDGMVFRGSCTAVGRAGLFVTAAHCIADIPQNELRINHHGITEATPYARVTSVRVYPMFDLAILDAVVERPRWIQPFTAYVGALHLGEEVAAIGWPAEYGDVATPRPTLRCFRGYVQRPFFFAGPGADAVRDGYMAYELSFPSPDGLSGGPAFLVQQPDVLVGIMTENKESFTTSESFENTVRHGTVIDRHTFRKVITYGVASNIMQALEDSELRQLMTLRSSGDT